MKICVAQIRPKVGDIDCNLKRHYDLIDLAHSNKCEMIIFPELSLTGYEPTLAKKLSITKYDIRLKPLQRLSDLNGVIIGVGAPLKVNNGIAIGMIIFQPNRELNIFYKRYLHKDEEIFFVNGPKNPQHLNKNYSISIAICYEIFIPEHPEQASKIGSKIYIASVAKHKNNIWPAKKSLAKIAKKYSMTVLMSNCVGECDGDLCTGNSALWNSQGDLTNQLNDKNEGIILFDTVSHETHTEYLMP